MENKQKKDIESLEVNRPLSQIISPCYNCLVKNKAAQALGKKGGQTTKKKYGKDHFRKLGQKAAKVRWGKARSAVA